MIQDRLCGRACRVGVSFTLVRSLSEAEMVQGHGADAIWQSDPLIHDDQALVVNGISERRRMDDTR